MGRTPPPLPKTIHSSFAPKKPYFIICFFALLCWMLMPFKKRRRVFFLPSFFPSLLSSFGFSFWHRNGGSLQFLINSSTFHLSPFYIYLPIYYSYYLKKIKIPTFFTPKKRVKLHKLTPFSTNKTRKNYIKKPTTKLLRYQKPVSLSPSSDELGSACFEQFTQRSDSLTWTI